MHLVCRLPGARRQAVFYRLHGASASIGAFDVVGCRVERLISREMFCSLKGVALIQRLLEKDPGRFQTPAELLITITTGRGDSTEVLTLDSEERRHFDTPSAHPLTSGRRASLGPEKIFDSETTCHRSQLFRTRGGHRLLGRLLG